MATTTVDVARSETSNGTNRRHRKRMLSDSGDGHDVEVVGDGEDSTHQIMVKIRKHCQHEAWRQIYPKSTESTPRAKHYLAQLLSHILTSLPRDTPLQDRFVGGQHCQSGIIHLQHAKLLSLYTNKWLDEPLLGFHELMRQISLELKTFIKTECHEANYVSLVFEVVDPCIDGGNTSWTMSAMVRLVNREGYFVVRFLKCCSVSKIDQFQWHLGELIKEYELEEKLVSVACDLMPLPTRRLLALINQITEARPQVVWGTCEPLEQLVANQLRFITVAKKVGKVDERKRLRMERARARLMPLLTWNQMMEFLVKLRDYFNYHLLMMDETEKWSQFPDYTKRSPTLAAMLHRELTSWIMTKEKACEKLGETFIPLVRTHFTLNSLCAILKKLFTDPKSSIQLQVMFRDESLKSFTDAHLMASCFGRVQFYQFLLFLATFLEVIAYFEGNFSTMIDNQSECDSYLSILGSSTHHLKKMWLKKMNCSEEEEMIEGGNGKVIVVMMIKEEAAAMVEEAVKESSDDGRSQSTTANSTTIRKVYKWDALFDEDYDTSLAWKSVWRDTWKCVRKTSARARQQVVALMHENGLLMQDGCGGDDGVDDHDHNHEVSCSRKTFEVAFNEAVCFITDVWYPKMVQPTRVRGLVNPANAVAYSQQQKVKKSAAAQVAVDGEEAISHKGLEELQRELKKQIRARKLATFEGSNEEERLKRQLYSLINEDVFRRPGATPATVVRAIAHSATLGAQYGLARRFAERCIAVPSQIFDVTMVPHQCSISSMRRLVWTQRFASIRHCEAFPLYVEWSLLQRMLLLAGDGGGEDEDDDGEHANKVDVHIESSQRTRMKQMVMSRKRVIEPVFGEVGAEIAAKFDPIIEELKSRETIGRMTPDDDSDDFCLPSKRCIVKGGNSNRQAVASNSSNSQCSNQANPVESTDHQPKCSNSKNNNNTNTNTNNHHHNHHDSTTNSSASSNQVEIDFGAVKGGDDGIAVVVLADGENAFAHHSNYCSTPNSMRSTPNSNHCQQGSSPISYVTVSSNSNSPLYMATMDYTCHTSMPLLS